MPIDFIPFGNNQPSIDIPGAQTAQQTGSVMRDVYVDFSGNIVKRPSLALHTDLGESTGVNGLYDWSNKADGVVIEETVLVAVSGGKPFKAIEYDGSFSEITNGTYTAFSTGNAQKVSFAEVGGYLYATNGYTIRKIDAIGSSCNDLTDVDIPASVKSITSLDRYLIAVQKTTGNFHWSDVNDPATWSGYYAETESQPDILIEAKNAYGFLYLFGKNTIEVFQNDGVTPFSRLSQSTINGGTFSEHGVCFCDAINTFVFMNHERDIARIDGKAIVPFSPSLRQFLHSNFAEGVSKYSVGNYFIWDGIPFYMFSALASGYSFVTIAPPGLQEGETGPSSGWSIAVNLLTGDWYEWGAYYSSESRYLPFQGCNLISTPVGVLAGDANDGLIHKLTRGGSDESAYGKAAPMARSIHLTRGAPGREKITNSLTFQFKAPQTHTSGEFGILVSYSDDGGSTWTSGRRVVADISTGQKAKIVTERNWGRYYQRQWMIEFDTTDDVALGPVIEDYDIV